MSSPPSLSRADRSRVFSSPISRITRFLSRLSLSPLLLVSLSLLLTACHTQPPIVPENLYPAAIQTTGPKPSYHDLITRYDRHVERLSPLWASTDVDMHWLDHHGKRQAENGSGVLIVVRPRDITFTVGKLGQTGLWAGSNNRRYWLFNLRDHIAYTGLYKNLGKPCTEPLPLPVQPEAVPYLLGLMPIDPNNPPSPPAVEQYRGYDLIAPPGQRIRMVLDPKTAQPVRVYWLDKQGRAVLVSKLTDRRPMRLANTPYNKRPVIAHQIAIYALGRDARLNLTLHDVTDGKADDQIHPGVFNWQVLLHAHQPKKVINLDQNCP